MVFFLIDEDPKEGMVEPPQRPVAWRRGPHGGRVAAGGELLAL